MAYTLRDAFPPVNNSPVHNRPIMLPSPNSPLVGSRSFRSQLNTPALGVDLDMLERNLQAMQKLAGDHRVALRPHGKAHKSSRIAKMQIDAGAVGVCCTTIGEAEVMAAGGIADILVTAPLSTGPKLARLAKLLATVPRLAVVVDQVDTVERLAKLAAGGPRKLTVLIDVDVGQRRTGVTTAEAAVEIARKVAASPALKLGGMQGYAGLLQAVVSYEERAAKCREVHDKLRAMRVELEKNGFRCEIVTGAGTGTALLDAASGVFTELQPGSYLFMDAQYSAVEIAADKTPRFPTGLRFFTHIISTPHAGFATTDGGHKSMAADGPAPKVVAGAPQDTVYKYSGDEFGRLEYTDTAYKAKVGTLIECHVPHCDTAMNLHDHLLGFRGDTLEAVWPIEARGAW
jgi:3-hydroxy-D-aspartate aldolase